MEDVEALTKKYMNDALFCQIVDHLYHVIHEVKLAPEELRQAFFLARYKYEINHVRPIAFRDGSRMEPTPPQRGE